MFLKASDCISLFRFSLIQKTIQVLIIFLSFICKIRSLRVFEYGMDQSLKVGEHGIDSSS